MELNPRARFVDELEQLRVLAGGPTLAALCEQNPGSLKRSTVSTLLAGEFVRVPPWERIAAFVTACVQIGRANQVTMPPEDVLLQQWKYRHEVLIVALDQGSPRDSRPPADDNAAPAVLRQRRRIGSVPPRAGAFQHRAVTAALTRSVEGGGTAVLTGAAPTTPASVLTGLGGVGKTQLAADHAHTMWDNHEVELLVWISARTREAITAGYADVAVELLGKDPAAPERACRRLLEWLAETPDRWLVVLDDVQAPSDLVGLWPPHSAAGQVVVTTRCRDAALHGDRRQVLDVDLFTPAEALAYLTDKLPGHAHAGHADLAGLAEDLGCLPLALAQAAAYLINKPLLTCADYRARLTGRRSTLRDVLPTEQDLPDEHEQTVAATWSLSIEAADQLDPAGLARPILEFASLLDPAGIPTAVFTTDVAAHYLTTRLARDVTADDVLGGLEALSRFSLLTLDPAQPDRAVRVHALVQRAVRDLLPVDTVGELARAVANALLDAWPHVESDQELVQALRSNTGTLQGTAEDHLWQPGGHRVLFRLARSLGEAGLLHGAITVTKRLYHRASTLLGPDHSDTLTTRSNLASWRGEAGDPAGAAAETEQLLIHEVRILGPDHPDVLITRNNLARWRGKAGDPAGAAIETEQLLTDQVRVLGPDHPLTLNTRSNLASWRGKAGDPAGAATAYKQLLTDQERILGPDHPLTLRARGNLAFWRGEAGDPAGAATAYKQLLTERLRVLGPDHLETLIARGNLAFWRGEAGDPARAAAETEQLLTDQVRVLGPDHPVTLISRGNLALWRGRAGDPAGAAIETEQLLTDQVRVLGPDHPDTLTNRGNLASWRGEAGDPARAVADYEQLLTDRLRVLGPDHPHTLTTRNNLAHWRSVVDAD
ncbi:FxSxx-COOH system tetratricopeptide repeat protein [Amycolatopsis sp. 195334CR]|uniref:FxSxx-COOH system tetratricopeptide repeat protein n=1 Tax=Amycolatopsis sp. 195334CR TaxID=2814588 RepID=UPI001A8C5B70|nr:FxSxx-COOH system tetratricopeptide repeat protein [Amycolatopsis sp. 195334CR]MBN6039992.1 tetratricopeptide repeat protein [Amycolatopsis sp. 195334CR]